MSVGVDQSWDHDVMRQVNEFIGLVRAHDDVGRADVNNHATVDGDALIRVTGPNSSAGTNQSALMTVSRVACRDATEDRPAVVLRWMSRFSDRHAPLGASGVYGISDWASASSTAA